MTESPRGLPVKEAIRLKSIRKVMAKTMKASVETAALSQIAREIDVTALQELRGKLAEGQIASLFKHLNHDDNGQNTAPASDVECRVSRS